MSETSMGHRVIALGAALLFLVTSLGFSILVVWQMHQNSASGSTPPKTSTTNSSQGSKKLEGTKLTGFTPVAKVSQLQSTDIKEGTGPAVTASDTITANYTGALTSTGVIFQSSLDTGQPFTSALSALIKGWQEGIPGMKAGGTRRLLIPAAEAYGSQAQQGIPANSDLVFDIQLIKIGK